MPQRSRPCGDGAPVEAIAVDTIVVVVSLSERALLLLQHLSAASVVLVDLGTWPVP